LFFVLKLSKLCNLRCTYCYEYDELGLPARMGIDQLEWFFSSLANAKPSGGWPTLNFVFHGGEPLLLPHSYLESLVAAQKRHLDPAGIKYSNSIQTNLTRMDDATLALLDRLNVGLGVSLDVFGGQRLTANGRDSQDKVLRNLQMLFDRGIVERLGVGIISVLHRENSSHVLRTFEFCRALNLSYRILPVFSLTEMPSRMTSLSMQHDEVVDALKLLAVRWFDDGASLNIWPLRNYLDAAIHQLLGVPAHIYDPRKGDWAYIINTNGDTYSHAEAYSEAGWMGNIFEQPFLDILNSAAHANSLVPRLARAEVCCSCQFGRSCSRMPLIESLPSERKFDSGGSLQCAIALPMIAFFQELLLKDAAAANLITAGALKAREAQCLLAPV
jgi:uncharacterized protein